MERRELTASNWPGVSQAGRRYIPAGRIIGLMGHSCGLGHVRRGKQNKKNVWSSTFADDAAPTRPEEDAMLFGKGKNFINHHTATMTLKN